MTTCGCGHAPRLHAPACTYLGCNCADYHWRQWQYEVGLSMVLLLCLAILWVECMAVDWVLSLARA